METIKYTFLILLVCLIYQCKQADKSSSTVQGGEMETELNESLEDKRIPEACRQDLEKLSQFMDDFIEMYEKKGKDGKLSDAEEKTYQQKAKDLGKEFSSSAGAYTDPNCAMELMKLQNKFNGVMIDMASSSLR